MSKFVRAFIFFLVFLSFDQFIKYFVISQGLDYYKNYGFLFGLISFRSPLISVLVVSAILILVIFFYRHPEFSSGSGSRNKFGMTWAVGWSLFLAGSASNIFDRISLGYVIDFLDWKTILPFWPESFARYFNLADVFIVAGIIIFAVGTRSVATSGSGIRE